MDTLSELAFITVARIYHIRLAVAPSMANQPPGEATVGVKVGKIRRSKQQIVKRWMCLTCFMHLNEESLIPEITGHTEGYLSLSGSSL